MYNNETKQQYIDWYFGNSTSINVEKDIKNKIAFFNRIGKIENEFNMDIASTDYETIKIMLGLLCRGSIAYQKVVLSELKKYINWCIENGKTPNKENYLDVISLENIDFSIANRMLMLKDEKQLNDYLDVVFKTENSSDIIYRACCLLLWHGFTIDEIINIKEADFNSDNSEIVTNNKKVKISLICNGTLIFIINTDYWVRNLNHSCKFKIIKTEFLLNTTSGNREAIKLNLINKLSTKNVYYRETTGLNILINSTNILKSGIFYRIYKKELETTNIDFEEYLVNFCKNKNESQIKAITKNAIIEYENWKKAYNL